MHSIICQSQIVIANDYSSINNDFTTLYKLNIQTCERTDLCISNSDINPAIFISKDNEIYGTGVLQYFLYKFSDSIDCDLEFISGHLEPGNPTCHFNRQGDIWIVSAYLFKYITSENKWINKGSLGADSLTGRASSLTYRYNDYYYLNIRTGFYDYAIYKLDTLNPANSSKVLVLSDTLNIKALFSIRTSCTNYDTYIVRYSNILTNPATGRPICYLSALNFETGEISDVCTLSYDEWFMSVAEPWDDYEMECELTVDLDLDNSTMTSGENNYYNTEFCRTDSINIADLDDEVFSTEYIDSLHIFFKTMPPDGNNEYLFVPATDNIQILNNNSQFITLVNENKNEYIDLNLALRTALYRNDSINATPGIREIGVVAYGFGKSSDTAVAYIEIQPISSAGQDNSIDICETDSSFLLGNLLSEGASSFGYWDKSTVDIGYFNPSSDDPGEYLYIVDRENCVADTAHIRINVHELPEFEQIQDKSLCYGHSLSIELNYDDNLSLVWDDGSEVKTRKIDSSGIYSYIIKDTFGCKFLDTFEVVISQKPVSVSINDTICKGESVTFHNRIYDIPGSYLDTLKTISGCDSILYTIGIENFDTSVIEFLGDSGFCEGNYTEIKIESPITNLEVNGVPKICPLDFSKEGNYTISGYDLNGCYVESEISIVKYPRPEIIPMDLIGVNFERGRELEIDYNGNIVEYNWYPNSGLNCYDCPFPFITEKWEGTYKINVKNEYGCEDEAFFTIKYDDIIINVPNIISANSLNPINSYFFVKSNIDFQYDLFIFDRWGELIYKKDRIMANSNIDGWKASDRYNPGVYVYMIKYEENNEQKVISGDVTLIK